MDTDTEKKLNSNYRLLVVDDDQEILSLLSNWLTREGFTISTAISGEQALAEVHTNKPNLVITDLYMNGMSGMQLLSAIHSDNPLFPVIFPY